MNLETFFFNGRGRDRAQYTIFTTDKARLEDKWPNTLTVNLKDRQPEGKAKPAESLPLSSNLTSYH